MRRMLVGFGCLLLAIAGCRTVISVNATQDSEADFSSYKTFSMAPPPAATPKDVPGYSEITGQRIQETIAAALKSRGYQQVSKGQADMTVAFSVSGQPRTDVWGTSSTWYGGGSIVSTHYIAGTLIIDAYDAAANKLVWHGWAKADFFEEQETDQGVERAVNMVMKKFPARMP